jgi:acyl transferase domain-containing protein/NADPH:quinone reductase-like Zn-dependent oxidoreductase/NAD(P)-dependent dehydrogenase (short-subunit alcohol dehydrogenase family)/acyl carrier protein
MNGPERDTRPVAIVGIGCRFPGGVLDAQSFWRLLIEGRDAIGEIPPSRMDIERFFDDRPATPGRIMSRYGGYLDGIDGFDAEFFGISPREAESLDPQQRLLLEIAWEALEDAGLDASRLRGSDTGVFVGQWISDFESRLFTDPAKVGFLMTTGSGRYASSGRISYALGLRGPSLTIDTACSSSLAAVHLAARAVRSGECGVALAGGVNLILQPHIHVAYSQSRMMAPDGHCKFGDAKGDGYVRSEGAGIVVLKRLADALAAGDRIYATVLGSAVNNDGDSSGSLGTPSPVGQRELLRAAYRDAGIAPACVGYVEAHGTGTRAGDPVELGAIADVLGPGRPSECRAVVGSVKTNLGHTEGAAGVAGLMKAALALHHGLIPSSLHLQQPTPAVEWADAPIMLARQALQWPELRGPHVAGVSAFGIAGTNAHVVLQAAPAGSAASAARADGNDASAKRPALLVLSARSPEALRALAARYAQRVRLLADQPRDRLDELCWSAATRRTALSHRAAFCGDSAVSLCAQLEAFASGEAGVEGQAREATAPIAFVVPGQGGQWTGMARDLIAGEPKFRCALQDCDAAAQPYLQCSIIEQLQLDPTAPQYRLDRLEVIQPTLVALAIAYARWLQSIGIVPSTLVGHSMGEVGAAHLAGVLDLDQAMRVICRRSALMARMRGMGGMAVVGLAPAELDRRLAAQPRLASNLSLAAINGPVSCVIAGESKVLAQFVAELEAAGVFARAVQVDVASHSPQMEGPAQALAAELAATASDACGPDRARPLVPREASVPILSTVLGRSAGGTEFDAEYWGRNMRQPVRFDPCVGTMLESGLRAFIELGAHPLLSGAIQQSASARSTTTDSNSVGGIDVVAVACGRRDEPGIHGVMAVVAQLWVVGHAVDWAALLPHGERLVDLPLYPWQRERHWCETANQMAFSGAAVSHRDRRASAHPLLARRFDPASAGARMTQCWETALEGGCFAFLADHVVRGSVLFPAAAYCEVALAAAAEVAGDRRFGLRDVRFHAAWALPTAGSSAVAQLQVQLEWADDDSARFEIHGRSSRRSSDAGVEEEPWVRRASGRLVALSALSEQPMADTDSPTEGAMGVANEIASDDIYRRLASVGLAYAPAFRGLAQAQASAGSARTNVRFDSAQLAGDASRYIAYPPLLDAMLQVQALALALADDANDATPIPVGLAKFDLLAPLSAQGSYAAKLKSKDGLHADIDLIDDEGRCVAALRGSDFELLQSAAKSQRAALDGLLFAPAWTTAGGAAGLPDATAQADIGPVLVIAAAEGDAAGRALIDALAVHGVRSTLWPASRLAEKSVAQHMARALQAAGGAARGHVVHLGALACPMPESGIGWIEAGWRRIGDDMLALARQLSALEGVVTPRLWLVTRDTVVTGDVAARRPVALGTAALWGLGRVWAHEQPALDLTLVDLDGDGVSGLPALLAKPPAERQLAQRSGGWLALQLEKRSVEPPERPGAEVPAFEAVLGTPGSPDSLHWRSATRQAPGEYEVEIEVEAAGLNFMNLMSVLGIYPGYEGGQGPLGIECSGRVVRTGAAVQGVRVGDAVLAVGHRCLQRFALVNADLVATRPAGLDAVAAAGMPIAFLTAAYGLLHLARLERGERVLIHSAAGGVGLAALQVARRVGAEVFATVGSKDKRALLHSLGVRQVFDSRSTAFADEVLAATAGRGVDVVLNSLAGEAIAAGLRCLAPYGRFVELGKRDIYGGASIGLAPFRANLAYFAVDLDRMMRERPAVLGRLLREQMCGFGEGTYQPLPVHAYGADEIGAAFRDLMPGTHVGKHVLALATPPARVQMAPGQHWPVRRDGVYVISGGLGALGLEVARWLARRGAGALLLIGRNAPSASVRAALAEIEGNGTRVLTAACDVADTTALAAALAHARREGGALRGVFHAAGVLTDATLGVMTAAQWQAPRNAKVLGAWHLDRLTAADPLEAFVLFSSVASLFGTPGQGNYAAANAFLDALAADRRARGKPALAINLGPVADVGLAAASTVRGDSLARLGFAGLAAAQVIEAIDALAAAGTTQAVCARLDPRRWLEATAHAGALGIVRAAAGPGAGEGAANAPITEVPLPAALAALPAGPPRRSLLENAVKAEVAAVLRMMATRVPTDRALKTLGLDSLMALELRNRLEKRTGLALSPTLAWNHPTVRALALHLAERLNVALDAPVRSDARAEPTAAAAGAGPEAVAAEPESGAVLDSLLDELERMSDAEARALLRGAAHG